MIMKAFGLILHCSNEIVFDKNVNNEIHFVYC